MMGLPILAICTEVSLYGSNELLPGQQLLLLSSLLSLYISGTAPSPSLYVCAAADFLRTHLRFCAACDSKFDSKGCGVPYASTF